MGTNKIGRAAIVDVDDEALVAFQLKMPPHVDLVAKCATPIGRPCETEGVGWILGAIPG